MVEGEEGPVEDSEDGTKEGTEGGNEERQSFPRGPLIKTTLPLTRTERGVLLLLIGAPVAVALHIMGGSPTLIFAAAAVSIIPLASLMGRATEELAVRTGPGVSGLLLATFGNATELIIAAIAIKEGYLVLAKASLTGSIIVNVLLILGLSFVVGGVKASVMKFHPVLASATLSMLIVSVVGILLPSLYHFVQTGFADAEIGTEDLLPMSALIAVVMIAVYILYLFFSLVTHRGIFDGKHSDRAERVRKPEPHLAEWPQRTALIVLALSMVSVTGVAELMIGEVESIIHKYGMSELFIGVMVIAVVGNAAEHSTAMLMAWRGRIELAFQIAMGSSAQIALLVAPVLVLLSFPLGNPMSLVFEPFELVAMIVTLAIAAVITVDGQATWFEGAMLVAIFLLLGAIFWIHP
jgi:Ca2+:H+ antiporter